MQALDVEDAKDAKRADLLARQKLGAGCGKKARPWHLCNLLFHWLRCWPEPDAAAWRS